MADSTYHYNQYISFKNAERKYSNDIVKLKILRERLDVEYSGIQRSINDDIYDVINALNKGIKHDGDFTSNIARLYNYTEVSCDQDDGLKHVVNALDEEIRRLENKKIEANVNGNIHMNNYNIAKAEEKKNEVLKASKSGGGRSW